MFKPRKHHLSAPSQLFDKIVISPPYSLWQNSDQSPYSVWQNSDPLWSNNDQSFLILLCMTKWWSLISSPYSGLTKWWSVLLTLYGKAVITDQSSLLCVKNSYQPPLLCMTKIVISPAYSVWQSSDHWSVILTLCNKIVIAPPFTLCNKILISLPYSSWQNSDHRSVLTLDWQNSDQSPLLSVTK